MRSRIMPRPGYGCLLSAAGQPGRSAMLAPPAFSGPPLPAVLNSLVLLTPLTTHQGCGTGRKPLCPTRIARFPDGKVAGFPISSSSIGNANFLPTTLGQKTHNRVTRPETIVWASAVRGIIIERADRPGDGADGVGYRAIANGIEGGGANGMDALHGPIEGIFTLDINQVDAKLTGSGSLSTEVAVLAGAQHRRDILADAQHALQLGAFRDAVQGVGNLMLAGFGGDSIRYNGGRWMIRAGIVMLEDSGGGDRVVRFYQKQRGEVMTGCEEVGFGGDADGVLAGQGMGGLAEVHEGGELLDDSIIEGLQRGQCGIPGVG